MFRITTYRQACYYLAALATLGILGLSIYGIHNPCGLSTFC